MTTVHFLRLLLLIALVGASNPGAQEPPPATPALAAVLSEQKWRQVEDSVDRALAWISARQQPDGSFPTIQSAQPSATSLSVMAFLSRGHQPGYGQYGEQLNRAIDFVLACQREDGLFSNQPVGPAHQDKQPSHTAAYNHAIAGLLLTEVFGQVTGKRSEKVKTGIHRALAFTRELQTRPKPHAVDQGGWRYLRLRFDRNAADSDLSVTGWQLLFLRSARNAEFEVPESYMTEALEFVRRCWEPGAGQFRYALVGSDIKSSRGMNGAGILSLSLAGQHQTEMALRAGDWLMQHPFRRFGETIGGSDRFFYSAYYCSQAVAQLGGNYWERCFPPLADALLAGQSADGSWPPEQINNDHIFGNVITTSMAVLSLTTPYQLLPVYQR